MKRKKLVRRYRRIAKELRQLQVIGANHISRSDNNAVFEFEHALKRIAERIAEKYSDTDYEDERARRKRT